MRGGFTLIELVVVLAVMGIALTVVAIDGAGLIRSRRVPADPIDALRRGALDAGRDTTALVESPHGPRFVTALLDGRVIEGTPP